MIIKSSVIAMQSSHLLQESTTREERLQFWVGSRNSGSGTPQQRSPLLQLVQSGKRDQVDLSAQARRLQLLAIEKPREELELTPEEDLKIKLIESMLELLSGKKIKIIVPFKNASPHQSPSLSRFGCKTNRPVGAWSTISKRPGLSMSNSLFKHLVR